MIAFEITINGKNVCTAGIGERGVLYTDLISTLLWVKRNPDLRSEDMPEEEWIEEELELSVRGVISHDKNVNEHLRWIVPSLSIGDEIVIRILNQPACDEPTERRRYNPKQE